MRYDVDNNYHFQLDKYGAPYLPSGMRMDGNLYVLPNGKYLPSGHYRTEDGGSLIYEPAELSPFADMLSEFRSKEK